MITIRDIDTNVVVDLTTSLQPLGDAQAQNVVGGLSPYSPQQNCDALYPELLYLTPPGSDALVPPLPPYATDAPIIGVDA